jgi:hypothetical protein
METSLAKHVEDFQRVVEQYKIKGTFSKNEKEKSECMALPNSPSSHVEFTDQVQ